MRKGLRIFPDSAARHMRKDKKVAVCYDLYVNLFNHADDDYKVTKSIEELAILSSRSERTVNDHLRALAENGFLHIQSNFTRFTHRRLPSTYTVTLPKYIADDLLSRADRTFFFDHDVSTDEPYGNPEQFKKMTEIEEIEENTEKKPNAVFCVADNSIYNNITITPEIPESEQNLFEEAKEIVCSFFEKEEEKPDTTQAIQEALQMEIKMLSESAEIGNKELDSLELDAQKAEIDWLGASQGPEKLDRYKKWRRAREIADGKRIDIERNRGAIKDRKRSIEEISKNRDDNFKPWHYNASKLFYELYRAVKHAKNKYMGKQYEILTIVKELAWAIRNQFKTSTKDGHALSMDERMKISLNLLWSGRWQTPSGFLKTA